MDFLSFGLALLEKLDKTGAGALAGATVFFVVTVVIVFMFLRTTNDIHSAIIDKANTHGMAIANLRTDIFDRFQNTSAEMRKSADEHEEDLRVQIAFLNQKLLQLSIDNDRMRESQAQIIQAVSKVIPNEEFQKLMAEAAKTLMFKRRETDV